MTSKCKTCGHYEEAHRVKNTTGIFVCKNFQAEDVCVCGNTEQHAWFSGVNKCKEKQKKGSKAEDVPPVPTMQDIKANDDYVKILEKQKKGCGTNIDFNKGVRERCGVRVLCPLCSTQSPSRTETSVNPRDTQSPQQTIKNTRLGEIPSSEGTQTLSDKMEMGFVPKHNTIPHSNFFWRKDVKTFIAQVKKDIHMYTDAEADDILLDVEGVIDKLAGERLIELGGEENEN